MKRSFDEMGDSGSRYVFLHKLPTPATPVKAKRMHRETLKTQQSDYKTKSRKNYAKSFAVPFLLKLQASSIHSSVSCPPQLIIF
jgi:hypothetical protein